ncbi:hypothetical protein CDAR_210671 [Caerostris darwini]|uniref:Uncharacterized protein n=1 Tax=Caerostris darwini TaxID=1538125 RepID=A0AAV4VQU7_9ARAC|nr:hypothetical protein CDAR_210671 [Caerostris darwini]
MRIRIPPEIQYDKELFMGKQQKKRTEKSDFALPLPSSEADRKKSHKTQTKHTKIKQDLKKDETLRIGINDLKKVLFNPMSFAFRYFVSALIAGNIKRDFVRSFHNVWGSQNSPAERVRFHFFHEFTDGNWFQTNARFWRYIILCFFALPHFNHPTHVLKQLTHLLLRHFLRLLVSISVSRVCWFLSGLR